MSEAEKQEGQKTVVAFITGLLIGGLLVWVFSSTPTTQAPEVTEGDETEEVADTNSDTTEATVTAPTEASKPVVGNGSLSVASQKAGETVALGATTYPAKEGWVVVRDYANGAAGKILGAARYNLDDGLLPTSVSLLRSTIAGNSYQVQFYTENGDKAFDTKSDTPVSGGEATFAAN